MIGQHIHFICSANVFRSRLAQALCQKQTTDPKLRFSSSGIKAHLNTPTGDNSWITIWLAMKYDLGGYLYPKSRQTSKKMLKGVTKIIFLSNKHYDLFTKKFGEVGLDHEVWNIQDIDNFMNIYTSKKPEDLLYILSRGEEIYCQIQAMCKALLS